MRRDWALPEKLGALAILAVQELIGGQSSDPRLWPAHQALAGWHFSARRPEEALAALRTAQSLAPGTVQPMANIGTLLALNGQPGPARDVLAQLLAHSQQRYVPPTFVASVYCALGEREAALDWLNGAREVRDLYLTAITLCSLVLKDEPRFDALRRELKRCRRGATAFARRYRHRRWPARNERASYRAAVSRSTYEPARRCDASMPSCASSASAMALPSLRTAHCTARLRVR